MSFLPGFALVPECKLAGTRLRFDVSVSVTARLHKCIGCNSE